MNTDLIGTKWKRKDGTGNVAKIVDMNWSVGGRPGTILTVVYAPDFKPSILPSTVFLSDFMADREPSL